MISRDDSDDSSLNWAVPLPPPLLNLSSGIPNDKGLLLVLGLLLVPGLGSSNNLANLWDDVSPLPPPIIGELGPPLPLAKGRGEAGSNLNSSGAITKSGNSNSPPPSIMLLCGCISEGCSNSSMIISLYVSGVIRGSGRPNLCSTAAISCNTLSRDSPIDNSPAPNLSCISKNLASPAWAAFLINSSCCACLALNSSASCRLNLSWSSNSPLTLSNKYLFLSPISLPNLW